MRVSALCPPVRLQTAVDPFLRVCPPVSPRGDAGRLARTPHPSAGPIDGAAAAGTHAHRVRRVRPFASAAAARNILFVSNPLQ